MQNIKSFIALFLNHLFEIYRFVKYANCFSINSEAKLQGKITFNYHSIEKGLINEPIRLRFGQAKIERLKMYLYKWVNVGYSLSNSQFLAACTVLKKYHELHAERETSIEDILNPSDVAFVSKHAEKQQGGTITCNKSDYFSFANASFRDFSNSRHSVRHFSNQLIEIETIKSVIDLAKNAPSVCNRQGYKAKYVNDDLLVKKILDIQSGLNTTAHLVKQLFVVTVDRSVFVSPAEWYQVFIDGGIFLQNLLYALHYHKIAAVSLNWSKHYFLDKKMERLINLNSSEKIISVVAIGCPPEMFKVPRSARKEVDEILEIISHKTNGNG